MKVNGCGDGYANVSASASVSENGDGGCCSACEYGR